MGYEKEVLYVPKGVRFVSEWKDYCLSNFDFPHILDKQIPGCGYTSYCLTCNLDLVLTSPRRILLENKENQHSGDVFYYRLDPKFESGESDPVDTDLATSKPTLSRTKVEYTKEELEEWRLKLKEDLEAYISKRKLEHKPIKIIVTYDSFGNVKDAINEIGRTNLNFGFNAISIDKFHVVVDEFQSIFVDSRFKSETEIKLLHHLKGLKKVCYVSATPMIDKYLSELDEFKDLRYFEFDWAKLDPGRVIKPDLRVHDIKPKSSIVQEAKKIIEKYKNGEFDVLLDSNNNMVQSTEAVFYVNSVNNIISIINKCELRPEEVNILCSNTPDNVSRIKRKIKRSLCGVHQIGRVPLKGEPHKMFTFCTRTVYLGADFYSMCARTFILSDANIDSLAVDISLDLPQILGRQRRDENPWKNRADFFYKLLGEKKQLSPEDFEEILDKKMATTKNLLLSYTTTPLFAKEDLANKYQKDARNSKYKDDYVAVNQEYDPVDNTKTVNRPVVNKLVYIAERRAFEIQQIDYKDRFTVFNVLEESEDIDISKLSQFVQHLKDTSIHITVRLKELCETEEFTNEEKKVIAHDVSTAFETYYCVLGPERCRALGYKTDRLRKEIANHFVNKDDVVSKILASFKVGEKYKKSDIKQELGKIYESFNLTKTPKANDLEEFFEIKSTLVSDSLDKSKRSAGFEIMKIKERE